MLYEQIETLSHSESIADDLPKGVAELKALLLISRKENKQLAEKVDSLSEENRQLKRFLFAHKSEKWIAEDKKQMLIFNEVEATATKEEKYQNIPSHKRRKAGRKALADSIPRVEIPHDLLDEEKNCASGHEMQKIGEDIREELKYVPAKLYVEKHLYPKYACKHCAKVTPEAATVKSAVREPQVIPRSFASPGLLAYLIISKYQDHLPLYRLERIFARLGVELSRQTMANWLIRVSFSLRRLLVVMRQDIQKGKIMTADETPFQVVKEPGRTYDQESYMWVFTNNDDEHPVVLYRYAETRSGKNARRVTRKFSGHLMSDGFSGYDACASKKIILIACWAHVRRKFKAAYDDSKSELSAQFLQIIQNLYRIERYLRRADVDAETNLEMRTKVSRQFLNELHALLIAQQSHVLTQSLLGKAISYAMNLWPRLTIFAQNGELPIDNNITENAIRPFAVGRKNWLFSITPRGAFAGSALYSVQQSAIANGLDLYQYWVFLLAQLPRLKTRADFQSVAPHRVRKGDFKGDGKN